MRVMHMTPSAHVILAAMCVVYATSEAQRRAPSGFTGVRGKKSVPLEAYDEPQESGKPEAGAVDKRLPSGFMGMRGKKPVDYGYYELPVGEDKRAPYGFVGMRGKKDEELAYYDELLKRGPQGFLGMRGKKYDEFDSPFPNDAYYFKRVPVGFMGMRGKKDFENMILDEHKRAPSTLGFYGTRGKKVPDRTGFFGTRGKKYPYEFRGKFVGVRGKKSMEEINVPSQNPLRGINFPEEQLKNVGQDLDLNQLMLLLTENDTNGGKYRHTAPPLAN